MMPPGGAPCTPRVPPERTTKGVGGRSSGTAATGMGVATARSLTNARIGNQGCGAIGAGYAAGCPGGYQATSDQRPVVAPPASQCVRDTEHAVHLDGWSGAGRKGMPPPHSSKLVSPTEAKNTCGVAHCAQYDDLPTAEIEHRRKPHLGGCYTAAGSQLRPLRVGKKGESYL